MSQPLLEGEYEVPPVNPLEEIKSQLDSMANVWAGQVNEIKQRLARIEHGMAIAAGGVKAESVPAASVRSNGTWELWKQKLGGKSADFIQALLDHGEMTQAQLKVVTHSGTSTIPQILNKLISLGLVTKNSGRYSLRTI